MDKRLNDLDTVEKNFKNNNFSLPINKLNDFIRDFNFI